MCQHGLVDACTMCQHGLVDACTMCQHGLVDEPENFAIQLSLFNPELHSICTQGFLSDDRTAVVAFSYAWTLASVASDIFIPGTEYSCLSDLQDDCPTYTAGETRDSILQAAALAARWKEPPRDALDTMVLGTAKLDALDVYEQVDFMPFDPTVKRTEGTIKGPDGKVFKVTKGAPNIIMNLVEVNKEHITKAVDWKVHELGIRGIRSLAVAKTDADGKWNMLGLLTFLDPPRPDTKRTIERSMEYGVDVKMITGDHSVIAKEMSRTLGMVRA
jgi:magnesium-transporting ATPase (P-type)